MTITNPLKLYLKEVRKIPKLSKEDEVKYFTQYIQNNDLNAMHKIVTGHLRFVVYVCKNYRKFDDQLEEYIQIGNVALMRAAKRYNPIEYPNNRFVTFVVHEIKAALIEFSNKFAKIINFATTKEKRRIVHASSGFDANDSSQENINTLMLKANATKKAVTSFMQWKNASSDIEDIDLLNYSTTDCTKFDNIYSEQKKEKLYNAIKTLPTRQANIIYDRYLNNRGVTLKDLGKEQNCSYENIRQIEVTALKSLRNILTEDFA